MCQTEKENFANREIENFGVVHRKLQEKRAIKDKIFAIASFCVLIFQLQFQATMSHCVVCLIPTGIT